MRLRLSSSTPPITVISSLVRFITNRGVLRFTFTTEAMRALGSVETSLSPHLIKPLRVNYLAGIFGVESPACSNSLGGHAMNHAIELPQALLKRLNKITEGTRTTPESIVNQAVKDRLDYEEWLLAEVDAGLADVKAGRVMSNEDFWKSIESARRGNKKAA